MPKRMPKKPLTPKQVKERIKIEVDMDYIDASIDYVNAIMNNRAQVREYRVEETIPGNTTLAIKLDLKGWTCPPGEETVEYLKTIYKNAGWDDVIVSIRRPHVSQIDTLLILTTNVDLLTI